jgi:hypothetical protein
MGDAFAFHPDLLLRRAISRANDSDELRDAGICSQIVPGSDYADHLSCGRELAPGSIVTAVAFVRQALHPGWQFVGLAF